MNRPHDGPRSPTRSSRTPPRTRSTDRDTGNAPPTTPTLTRHCSCPPSAAPSPPTTRGRVATLHAIDDQLTEDGYVYRYRPDERPLGNAEGAFLVCGFWMALAWAQQGEHTAAARWFERNRAACGPPGLLAEEFDVTQRQLRGNLPQAFVHALLLECAAGQHTQSSDEGFAEQ